MACTSPQPSAEKQLIADVDSPNGRITRKTRASRAVSISGPPKTNITTATHQLGKVYTVTKAAGSDSNSRTIAFESQRSAADGTTTITPRVRTAGQYAKSELNRFWNHAFTASPDAAGQRRRADLDAFGLYTSTSAGTVFLVRRDAQLGQQLELGFPCSTCAFYRRKRLDLFGKAEVPILVPG